MMVDCQLLIGGFAFSRDTIFQSAINNHQSTGHFFHRCSTKHQRFNIPGRGIILAHSLSHLTIVEMENQVKNTPAVLQELMAVHNTRIHGYEQVQQQNADEELKTRLTDNILQSQKYIAEMVYELSQYGDAAQSDVNRDNTFHKVWADAEEDLAHEAKFTILDACQRIEEALLKTYDELLESVSDLPDSTRHLLQRQRQLIEQAYQSLPTLNNPATH